jgi:hypothetical protein
MDNVMASIVDVPARLAAAIGGKTDEYKLKKLQRREALDDTRKRAMAEDLFEARVLLDADPARAVKFLEDRMSHIERLGGDPAETQALMQQIASGDIDAAKQGLDEDLVVAQRLGYLPKQEAKPLDGGKVVNGQVIMPNGQGGFKAAPVEGFKQDGGKAVDRQLRAKEIELAERAQQHKEGKLSAGLEQRLAKVQNKTQDLARQANEAELLAQEYQRYSSEIGSGVSSSFTEFLKGVFGTQDDATEFRRRYNQIRISRGLQNLPPGVASDSDVRLAMKGLPKEDASPEQVSSFLNGVAKIARIDAAWNMFQADYISDKKTGSGMLSAWRKKTNIPALGREVSMMEVYQTALNRGITPEEVIDALNGGKRE